jgi:regulator of cell morphogenesis and NO signaling
MLELEDLYSALAEFEQDLHQHIHLENNILFPRAIQREEGR